MSESKWIKESLDKCANLIHRKPLSYKGVKPYVATADVHEFVVTPSEQVTYIDRPSRADVLVQENEILQSKMKESNKAVYIDIEKSGWLFSTGFALFSPEIIGNSSRYFYQYLKSDLFLHQRDILSVGSTQQAIADKDISKILVKYPSNTSHQQKIAEILSTIDEAIEKTDELIKKYKLIKTGLMHDLFTRGVTSAGKLRPPREEAPTLYKETEIGWIPRDWEAKQLGKILDEKGGYLQTGPFGSQLHAYEYKNEGIPVIMPQNIEEGIICEESISRISEERATQLSRHRVRIGDIVIARRGDLSRSASITKNEVNWICGSGCFLLRLGGTELRPDYFSYAYRHYIVQRQVASLSIGTTMSNLNHTVMRKLIFPWSKEYEQNEIANRLQSCETKIDILMTNKRKLEAQKLGLMHDLLTGKKEVKIETTKATNV